MDKTPNEDKDDPNELTDTENALNMSDALWNWIVIVIFVVCNSFVRSLCFLLHLSNEVGLNREENAQLDHVDPEGHQEESHKA